MLIRSDKMSSYMYTVETVVRGYHMYKEVWDATIGQVLPCQKEHGNVHDPYAVTVLERERCHCWACATSNILGLLLISWKKRQVTGATYYSIDLPQGGLEVPCKLIFSSKSRVIVKVQKSPRSSNFWPP